jgi:hypothetical protein
MAVPDRGRLGKLLPLKTRMTGTGTATALYPDTRMRRQRRHGGVDKAATPAVDFGGGRTRLGIRSLRSLEGSPRLGNHIFFFFVGPSLCTFHIVSRVDHYYPLMLGPTLLPMPGVYIAHALKGEYTCERKVGQGCSKWRMEREISYGPSIRSQAGDHSH